MGDGTLLIFNWHKKVILCNDQYFGIQKVKTVKASTFNLCMVKSEMEFLFSFNSVTSTLFQAGVVVNRVKLNTVSLYIYIYISNSLLCCRIKTGMY